MKLWAAHKEYNLDQMKTVITKVEPYYEYIKGGGSRKGRNEQNMDVVWAVDAIGAWKAAKEKHDERD